MSVIALLAITKLLFSFSTVTTFDKSRKGHFERHDNLVVRFDGLYHKDMNIRLDRKNAEKLIKALQKTLIVKLIGGGNTFLKYKCHDQQQTYISH